MTMKQKFSNSLINNKNDKEFAVALLLKKAELAYKQQPEDSSLWLLANVLGKFANKGKLTISKSAFQNLFREVASTQSLAAQVFTDELDIKEQKPTRKLAGEKVATKDFSPKGCYDESLKNAYAELWVANGTANKTPSYKHFDNVTADKAKNITHLELTRLGMEPKEIDVVAGHKGFVLCKASYVSPKGLVSIMVPVQVSDSKTAIPTFFATQYGFAELNKQAVNSYLNKVAGLNYTIDLNNVFGSLTNEKIEVLSDFSLNALATQDAATIKQAKQNIGKEPIKPTYEGTELFAKKLATVSGTAEFKFGKPVVELGRNKVASKLEYIGYKPQIKVSSIGDDFIMYAVAIDTKAGKLGFEVMAEVDGTNVKIPSIVAVDDKVYELSYAGIEKLVNTKTGSLQALAKVSPLYDMEKSDIVKNVKLASEADNYKNLEEALTVLAEKGDTHNYNIALAEYLKCINKTAAKKEEPCSCSKVIKICNASYCGHLHAPLDQVCQDENGNCVMKYRKKMAQTAKYNNIVLNTSKIIFS